MSPFDGIDKAIGAYEEDLPNSLVSEEEDAMLAAAIGASEQESYAA